MNIPIDNEQIRIRVKSDPIISTGATSGTTNAVSLGGEAIYKQKVGNTLQFKGLEAGTGISLVPSATGITINATVTGITGYVTESNFNTYTGATETRLDGIEADIVYISGVTDSKLPTSRFNTYTGATATVLNNINSELDLAVTGGTSGTGIAVSKVGRNLVVTFTGATGSYVSQSNFNTYTGTTDPILDGAITGITAGSNLLAVQTGRVVNISYTGATGGGAGVTLEYKYDSNTGAGSPAAKFFRLNNADAASATEVRFAYSTNNSVDASTVLLAAKTGAKLYLQLLSNSDEAVLYNITANPVDNGTYVTFTVTLASAGVDTTFTNNAAFGIILNPTGSYVSQSNFNTYTGATETRLDGIEADIVYISGVTDSKLPTSRFNTYTGATQTALDGKVDESNFNTFTGTTLPATYKKISEFNAYTGATQTALDGKVDESNFNTYTGATSTALSNINSELDLAVTGGTSLGGIAIYAQKTGRNLEFKGLVAGSNITLTPSSTGVTIASSGGGGGFDPSGTTVVPLGKSLSGNRGVVYSMFAADADEVDYAGSAGINRNSGVNGQLIFYQKGTGDFVWADRSYLTGGTAALTLTKNGLMSLRHPTNGSNSFSIISGSGSTLADFIFQKGNNSRWILRMDSATESGSNAGSNLALLARADDGSANLTPLSITRETGQIQIRNGANIYGDVKTVTGTTTLTQTDGGKIIECNGTFTITLPNGMDNGLKYTIVNVGTGVITIAATGTMKSLDSRTKLRFQYAGATAYHRGSNDWMVIGNLQD